MVLMYLSMQNVSPCNKQVQQFLQAIHPLAWSQHPSSCSTRPTQARYHLDSAYLRPGFVNKLGLPLLGQSTQYWGGLQAQVASLLDFYPAGSIVVERKAAFVSSG